MVATKIAKPCGSPTAMRIGLLLTAETTMNPSPATAIRTPNADIAVCAVGRIRSDSKVGEEAENLVEMWESKESERTTVISSWYAPATPMVMSSRRQSPGDVLSSGLNNSPKSSSRYLMRARTSSAWGNGAPSLSVMLTVRSLAPVLPGSSFASMLAPEMVSV